MTIPQKFIEGLTTKADKIRALDSAGFSRTEIAQFLGIRYQHVRNTLVQGSTSRVGQQKAGEQKLRSSPAKWPVERLLEAGFERLGACEWDGADRFTYEAQAPVAAGVYVFAVDGFVRYVGLTRFGLRTRLGHYTYGHERQKTSARVKSLILDALRDGQKVEVLISQPPELTWNGLPVDGAAGLETGLIRLIKPDWNLQGNR